MRPRNAKPKQTTTQRGLGWDHQKKRAVLLAVHRDGTPCWWCARPMFRDKQRNFDGQALAADHEIARANGGTEAGRLLHGSCNSARQEGLRDHERPALSRITLADLEAQRGANNPPDGHTEAITAPSRRVTRPKAPIFDWPDPPG